MSLTRAETGNMNVNLNAPLGVDAVLGIPVDNVVTSGNSTIWAGLPQVQQRFRVREVIELVIVVRTEEIPDVWCRAALLALECDRQRILCLDGKIIICPEL